MYCFKQLPTQSKHRNYPPGLTIVENCIENYAPANQMVLLPVNFPILYILCKKTKAKSEIFPCLKLSCMDLFGVERSVKANSLTIDTWAMEQVGQMHPHYSLMGTIWFCYPTFCTFKNSSPQSGDIYSIYIYIWAAYMNDKFTFLDHPLSWFSWTHCWFLILPHYALAKSHKIYTSLTFFFFLHRWETWNLA